MTDRAVSKDFMGQIRELVDIIALEKPIDWESINYDGCRDLAISGAVNEYLDVMENEQLGEDMKHLSLISIMSYLILENMAQWIMIEQSQRV